MPQPVQIEEMIAVAELNPAPTFFGFLSWAMLAIDPKLLSPEDDIWSSELAAYRARKALRSGAGSAGASCFA